MCDQCAPRKPAAATGSRRRRLWDLPHQCHCPVVGVCLPLGTLRRLVNKAVGGKAIADDYEVHVGAVAECTRRNRLSELLQGELEKRYAAKIQLFRTAKDAKAVAALWAQAVNQGDVAGAFWAALTHPRCEEALQEALCRDMHMLQHQAGAAVRVNVARFNELLHENGVLGRELGRVQERSTAALAEKSGEIERLTTELIQLRALNVTRDSRIAFLLDELATVKASMPEYETVARLQRKVEQTTARQVELETQNAELRHQLHDALRRLDARSQATAERAEAQAATITPAVPVTVHLKHKTVLCVGGRNGNIANYRDIIERVGGRFAHHDGGIEDNPNVLDASLAAADLVICQTGCISHNAYWKVKDFCKRTGKRCVFVENPSVSSLARGLAQIAEGGEDAAQAEAASLVKTEPALP